MGGRVGFVAMSTRSVGGCVNGNDGHWLVVVARKERRVSNLC
jgi:hypothetical protein